MKQPSTWYIQIGKEKRGPITADTIIKLYKTGVIKENTLVWSKGLSKWVHLSQTGIIKGITSEQIKKTKFMVLIGLCAVILIGIFGIDLWKDAHRLDGAWQGKAGLNCPVTFYFEPNVSTGGTTINILNKKSAIDDQTATYAYTVKKISSNSVEIDYCEFFLRDGKIVLDSDKMNNYVITFTGDNTADIDNCGGVSTISKIDSARAKSILGIP